MSFQTWINYGYGICCDNIPYNHETALPKIREVAPNFAKDLESMFEDATPEELKEPYGILSDNDLWYGSASVLAEIMAEAEGLEFTACDNFDGSEYVLYQPSYPWQMKDNERGLTEEKLAELFRKYAAILTDEPVVVDYFAVVNGG